MQTQQFELGTINLETGEIRVRRLLVEIRKFN
jgi:hypothetical protein